MTRLRIYGTGAAWRYARQLTVSAIVGAPFLMGGVYGITVGGFEPWTSGALLLIGALLMIVGFWVSVRAVFPTPTLVDGETELSKRHPTMKPAYARMMLSIPFFMGTVFAFAFTELPYVYPFALLLISLFLFFKGATRYLRNLHITYTVTDRRVIHMYRFMWLYTTEIPVSRIISISESRSFFEILTGRGSVVVASGIGKGQTIRIEEIDDPGPVASTLRELLPT